MKYKPTECHSTWKGRHTRPGEVGPGAQGRSNCSPVHALHSSRKAPVTISGEAVRAPTPFHLRTPQTRNRSKRPHTAGSQARPEHTSLGEERGRVPLAPSPFNTALKLWPEQQEATKGLQTAKEEAKLSAENTISYAENLKDSTRITE